MVDVDTFLVTWRRLRGSVAWKGMKLMVVSRGVLWPAILEPGRQVMVRSAPREAVTEQTASATTFSAQATAADVLILALTSALVSVNEHAAVP